MEQMAKQVNILARFLGRRDVPELTNECLMSRYGFPQADVMVLFGGSVLEGGKVLADAMRAGAAKRHVIVGGAGHTTETLRMDAGARKHFPQGTTIINYAAYEQEVAADGDGLRYTRSVWGMWDMDRYLALLMGEIPRLRDDAQGYGPNGKGYIAHVDIPADVIWAFERLQEQDGNLVRPADARFHS